MDSTAAVKNIEHFIWMQVVRKAVEESYKNLAAEHLHVRTSSFQALSSAIDLNYYSCSVAPVNFTMQTRFCEVTLPKLL